MKNSKYNYTTTKLGALLAIVAVILMITGVAIWPVTRTLAQDDNNSLPSVGERVSSKLFQAADAERSVATDAAPSIGPEAVTGTSYPFTSSSGVSLDDMSTGTTQLVAANQDDTASTLQNIGFDFWYDGTRLTQFSANANGLMRLGSTVISTGFTNSLASTTDAPKVAPFWDDLCTGTSGKVHYKVTGSAPNRKLIVEWKNMQITRNGACGGVGTGTFQVWLFETTGIIELVYGSGLTTSNDGGYSVGLQSGAATNFAAVTTSGPTVSYAAANDTQTTAITSGTAYIFTPNVPSAPTGLNFTSVAPLSMTLNWTDNASNELGYAIYQSTDNVNYSFVTQAAANATSQSVSGLNPSTTYFFKVYAVTEGALSSVLSGSQATTAAGSVLSTAAGGNWSDTATWAGSVVPTSTDNVTIVDGATVTIDTAAVALNLTVGTGGSAAVLQWDSTTARTLTLGQGVTIASNGTFQSATIGTVTTHSLTVGTDLTNNGVLDFSTNANTAGAGITFTGAANNTFGGTGATTDIRTLTINKGSSNSNILELNPTNFTVQGTTTDGAPMAFLTLTNGTLKISGTFAVTGRVFTTAAYTIGSTAGFWLNNPNFTVAGQNGSPTESGLLRISQGTFNIGTSTGNSMGFSSNSTITVEGGAINATGRFGVASSTNIVNYTQSGGTITVCTVGNASTTLGSFDLGTSASSNITMSGGTIVVQLASSAIDYRYDSGGSLSGLTGGTVQFGNASSGAAKTFSARGVAFNYVVNTTSAGHTVNLSTTLVNWNHVAFGINIGTGGTFGCGNSIFFIEGDVVNNGTLTATGASVRLYNAASSAQTYSGSGVFTAPVTSFELDNANGLTITTTNQIPTSRIILFNGSITNSNKITLGNGGTTTGTVQIGNTTTATNAGTLDAAPTFNLGTGGQVISYLRTTNARTTGFEVNPTRSLTTFTYDDNDATHSLTISGGNLTVTGTSNFTNGRIITGSNNFIVGSAGTVARTNGYVDGNLRKTYTVIGSKTYEVGTANGYSPVTVNATAGTFPADFTVSATQGAHPSVNSSTSIQRYWTLTNTTISSADLTFTYLAGDVQGTEANYKVIRISGGTPVSFPLSTVNTGTHVASLTGVTSFSDWTVGEISAPTAAPATIRGRITDAGGQPIAGVVITLNGSEGIYTTITDSLGRYTFSNVLTDRFYTLTPMRANYNFNPTVQSFSLLGNRADADFTAFAAAVAIANPLDTAEFFVRQQYMDFLGREPDQGGLDYWSNQLKACGSDLACIHNERINISAAFFMSEEFQKTGNYIYQLYKAGLGRELSYTEFTADHQKIVDGDNLEGRRAAFATEFVSRSEFAQKYNGATSAESFVAALLETIRQTDGVDLSAQRDALVARYNSGTSVNESRALVLRDAIEAKSFRQAEYNRAFVLTEYFGYLHRDADSGGLNFWLDVLNNRVPGNFRSMVCAFITSREYQQKFSSVVTRSNAECVQ